MAVVVVKRSVLERVQRYEANVRSLMRRYDKLRRKYGGFYVASQNDTIIDSDKDLRRLCIRLEKSGKVLPSLVIQYIYKERPQMFL